MPIRIYHYPRCSTCSKALKWLAAEGVQVERIDIVEAPPSVKELREILELSQLPIGKLFNTSGESYRAGQFSTRLKQMSQAEALAALAADGKLIKRPLLVAPKWALVGFDEAAYTRAFS